MRRLLLNLSWLSILLLALTGQSAALAKGLSFTELKQRSLEIEGLPQVKRDALQRNWKTFQALPDGEKQRYRRLHQELEADRKAGNQLNQTLETYEAWLQTLAPGERVALRDAATPEDRLRKVQEIKLDRERRNQSRALENPSDDPSRPRWGLRRSLAPPLTQAELNAVMEGLAKALPIPDQDDLERLDPERDKWQRYSQIIKASARQAGGPQNWPNLNQQAEIANAIPTAEPTRLLKSLLEDQRRMRWGTILFSSFREEMKRQREPFHPKETDLARVFEHLEAQERDKLMSVPKEWLKWELTRRYLKELEGTNPDYQRLEKASRDFFSFSGQFMGDAGLFRGPPGSGRRLGGQDGPRNGPFRNDRGRGDQPPDPPPRDGNRPPPRPGGPRDGE